MTYVSKHNESIEDRLAEITGDYCTQLANGEAVTPDEYIERYPQLADHLKRILPAVAYLRHSSSGIGGRMGELSFSPPPILGDFRLDRELGRGGMGVVFEAEQLSMGRRVALKILPFATLANAKIIQRFRNEVRAAASLDHPHIVSVYSVGEERGVHYYAMQLVRGQSLAEVIDQLKAERTGERRKLTDSSPESGVDQAEFTAPDVGHRRPATSHLAGLSRRETHAIATTITNRPSHEFFRQVATLGIQAAEALQYAHEQGIVHRDVKPANILLDPNNELYITDFGLATIEGEVGLTMTGDLVGTLRYMAPEQAAGERSIVDNRADVYSLAATLYELLTLRPIFAGSDRRELMRQIAFDEPLPLRRLDGRIPRELETIVLKGLAKNPDERYATARGVAEDLGRFLAEEPIRARPPTWVQRTVKWSRRNRLFVATVIGTLMVCLSIGSALLWRAHRQTNVALAQASENLQIARAVVDDLYVQVAEKWLEDQPHFTGVQREFIEKAVRFYETLPITDQTDADMQRQTALVQYRVGELRCKMGDLAEADAAYRRSVSLYESLAKRHVLDQDDTLLLAKALGRMGSHLVDCHEGRRREDPSDRLTTGEGALQRACTLLRPLAQSAPDDVEIKDVLASAYRALAAIRLRSKQYDAAEPLARQAVEMMESAIELVPDRAMSLHRLAGGSRQYADVLQELDRNDEAERALRRAVNAGRQALLGSPDKFILLDSHAENLFALGNFLHLERHSDDAAAPLEEASKLLDELRQKFAEQPNLWERSIAAHLNLTTIYKERSHVHDDDSSLDVTKAIEHGEKLVRVRRLAIDRHPSHFGQDHDQFCSELIWLAELFGRADRQPEMRKTCLAAAAEKFKYVERLQREVDRAPQDDEKRFALFSAISHAARLTEAGGRRDEADRLQERAWSELYQIRTLPGVEGEDVEGNSLRLTSYHGRVVLLGFFGDWCPDCRQIYAWQRQLLEAYQGRPFVTLGVNSDRPETLRDLIQRQEVTWPCWADGHGGPIDRNWRVPGWPMMYLIDHRGAVRRHQLGDFHNAEQREEFRLAIEKLVSEADPLPRPNL